jgi:hypothetical protein
MASGIGNIMVALVYKIRKYNVAEKRPDGAVKVNSSSFFAVPLPFLCQIYINLWVKFSL